MYQSIQVIWVVLLLVLQTTLYAQTSNGVLDKPIEEIIKQRIKEGNNRLDLEVTDRLSIITENNNYKFAQLWQEVIKQTRDSKIIRVANTVKNNPECKDVNLILEAFPQAVTTFVAKRYGDYLAILGTFQRRLLCLNSDSINAIDRLLVFYLMGSRASLPPHEAAQIRLATFNLGLLTFDQQTSILESYWWLELATWEKEYSKILSDFPNKELGIWGYNPFKGILKQLPLKNAASVALDAVLRSESFSTHSCYAIDLREKSTLSQFELEKVSGKRGLDSSLSACVQKINSELNTGNGSVIGNGGGDIPAPELSCIVGVARERGLQGQLTCVSNALGVESSQIPSIKTNMQGVPDNMCTISQNAPSNNWNNDRTAIDVESEKTWLDRVWDWVTTVFDVTPLPDTATKLASEQGAIMEHTFIRAELEREFKDYLATLPVEQIAETRKAWSEMSNAERVDFMEEKKKEREEKNQSDTQQQSTDAGNEGQHPIDGSGGGPCSDRTGASARAQRAFKCITGEEITWNTNSPLNPGNPNSPETINPDVVNNPPNPIVNCLSQGGEQLRSSFNDPRCRVARCVDPNNCTCDGKGNNADMARVSIQELKEKCYAYAYCSGDGPCNPCGGEFLSKVGIDSISSIPIPVKQIVTPVIIHEIRPRVDLPIPPRNLCGEKINCPGM